MALFSWLRRGSAADPARSDVSRRANIGMAITGLSALHTDDFMNVIFGSISARVAVRHDLRSERLEDLSHRIGRLAHETARKEGRLPLSAEVEPYHLPHVLSALYQLDGRNGD